MLKSWKESMQALRNDLLKGGHDTPVLLLWGARDFVVPVRSAKPLLECFQNARLVVLPGVSHVTNEEAPRQAARLVQEFLDQFTG